MWWRRLLVRQRGPGGSVRELWPKLRGCRTGRANSTTHTVLSEDNFGRVFPFLLPSERCDVEIVPRSPHLFVAAIVDEVGAKHAIAIADERIRAVPLVHAEVLVEVIRDRIPGDELPAHTRL